MPSGLAFVPDNLLDAPASAFYGPGEGGGAAAGAASPAGFDAAEAKKRRGLPGLLKWGAVPAGLADGASTAAVIAKGGRELHPMLEPFAQNTPALMGFEAGKGALMGVAADSLAKHGHRDLAKAMAILNIVLPLGASAYNMVNASKLDRARRGDRE
jgi:hypothetical protein